MSLRVRRAQRIFVAVFIAGFLVCGWALFSAAAQSRDATGDATRVESRLLGVTFFSVSRDGRHVSIRPHLGVALTLVALPALAAAVRYGTEGRRAIR